jgi:hypothetical protein
MNRGSLHTYSEAFGFATPGRLSIDYYHKTTAHERPSRFMFEQAFKYIDDGQSEKVAAAPGIQRQIVMKTATKRRPFFRRTERVVKNDTSRRRVAKKQKRRHVLLTCRFRRNNVWSWKNHHNY